MSTVAVLATAPAESQLIVDVGGRALPEGYSVRKEPSVPSTTVTFTFTALASSGRPGMTRSRVCWRPSGVLRVPTCVAGRVSRSRVVATVWNASAVAGSELAASSTPPPARAVTVITTAKTRQRRKIGESNALRVMVLLNHRLLLRASHHHR